MRASARIGLVALVALGAAVGIALQGGSRTAPRATPRLTAQATAETRAAVSHGVGATPSRTSSLLPPSHATPCGAASTATLAGVYSEVAQRIYNGELRGNEVGIDIAHITGSRELLSALAGSNQTAIYAAVHRIVYTPHWHIVRLRVLRGGRVLADVGGPYIIAPISGPLRWHGRTVGTFVTSVQDDIGYVKLVSRFTGVPIDIYRNGSFLMGTLRPAPGAVRDGQPVTVGGKSFEAHVLHAQAFPTGTLAAVLFVPRASGAVAARSCTDVRVLDGWGNVAKHIASRFSPLAANYTALVDTLQGSSGGFAYVRAGSRRLAGGSAPASIPSSGTIRYRGRSWSVFSWEPVPPARVYLLTPAGT